MVTERLKLAGRWFLWLTVGWLLLRGALSVVHTAPAGTSASTDSGTPQLPPETGVHAVLFARDYLTWQADNPSEHATRLRPWLPTGIDPHAVVDLRGAQTSQEVQGAWVYRLDSIGPGRMQVTVLAEVVASDEGTPARMVLLTVPVMQTPSGPALYDLPAFVPMQRAPAESPAYFGDAVSDPDGEVRSLVEAFFRALADGSDARFYVVAGAKVTPFAPGTVSLASVPQVRILKTNAAYWAVADVAWTDRATGAQYLQRYALELTRQDRWLIKQVLQKGV